MEKPWLTGPKELLQHGLEHLMKDTDFDRRIALISIDNAVELMIKTYLSLPRRVTGINISHAGYEQVSESFPGLVDALEKHASDKLIGIDLVDLEWYHRIRNKIYHEGTGITVERQKVESYAEIAKILFENLFGTPIEVPKEFAYPTIIGKFIDRWAKLEKTLQDMAELSLSKETRRLPPRLVPVDEMPNLGLVSRDFVNSFNQIRVFRNNLVHGLETPSTEEVKDCLSKLDDLIFELRLFHPL